MEGQRSGFNILFVCLVTLFNKAHWSIPKQPVLFVCLFVCFSGWSVSIRDPGLGLCCLLKMF